MNLFVTQESERLNYALRPEDTDIDQAEEVVDVIGAYDIMMRLNHTFRRER